jgi:putative addiction module component (TIGR02574 family)
VNQWGLLGATPICKWGIEKAARGGGRLFAYACSIALPVFKRGARFTLMETVDVLAEKVMQLPVGQRLTLAHRILASMDDHDDGEGHEEWDREIRARIERYDENPQSALAGPSVFEELDKKLGQ